MTCDKEPGNGEARCHGNQLGVISAVQISADNTKCQNTEHTGSVTGVKNSLYLHLNLLMRAM